MKLKQTLHDLREKLHSCRLILKSTNYIVFVGFNDVTKSEDVECYIHCPVQTQEFIDAGAELLRTVDAEECKD